MSEKYGNLNKILNGHRDIYYDFICRLTTRFPEIDLNWLLRNDIEVDAVMEPVEPYKKKNTADLLAELERITKELRLQFPQK